MSEQSQVTVEWGVRHLDGRIDSTASSEGAARYDAEFVYQGRVVSRTTIVTPWVSS